LVLRTFLTLEALVCNGSRISCFTFDLILLGFGKTSLIFLFFSLTNPDDFLRIFEANSSVELTRFVALCFNFSTFEEI